MSRIQRRQWKLDFNILGLLMCDPLKADYTTRNLQRDFSTTSSSLCFKPETEVNDYRSYPIITSSLNFSKYSLLIVEGD